jgi:hypothetical protein
MHHLSTMTLNRRGNQIEVFAESAVGGVLILTCGWRIGSYAATGS